MKSAVRTSRGLLDAISAQNGVVLGGPARFGRAAMARWHGRGARRCASRAMHNYFGEDFVHRGAPRGAGHRFCGTCPRARRGQVLW